MLCVSEGTGEDSFRRLAGGLPDVGEGVGNDLTAEGGLDTTIVEDVVTLVVLVVTVGACAGVAGGAATGVGLLEALPERLYDPFGSGVASTTTLIRLPSAYALPSSSATFGLTQVPARRVMWASFVEPLFPLRSKLSFTYWISAFSSASLALGKAARNMVVKLMAPVSNLRRMKACPDSCEKLVRSMLKCRDRMWHTVGVSILSRPTCMNSVLSISSVNGTKAARTKISFPWQLRIWYFTGGR